MVVRLDAQHLTIDWSVECTQLLVENYHRLSRVVLMTNEQPVRASLVSVYCHMLPLELECRYAQRHRVTCPVLTWLRQRLQ